jgi:hypothetical protein
MPRFLNLPDWHNLTRIRTNFTSDTNKSTLFLVKFEIFSNSKHWGYFLDQEICSFYFIFFRMFRVFRGK